MFHVFVIIRNSSFSSKMFPSLGLYETPIQTASGLSGLYEQLIQTGPIIGQSKTPNVGFSE